jgi:hypothetical protein
MAVGTLAGAKMEKCRRYSIPSSSAYITDQGIVVVSATSFFWPDPAIKPRLMLLPPRSDESVELTEFSSGKNLLLHVSSGCTFLGLDNKLLLSHDLRKWRTVLTANSSNTFWHMAEAADGTLFVHEYGFGEGSGIYRSADGGETWKQVVECHKLDKRALHFHSVAYDGFRGLLIATLGDRNILKIAVSKDYGDTWKPLYNGAWQCLPIVILKERIIFGMDSGISRGFLVWHPSDDLWETIHLKYVKKPETSDLLQIADLRALTNGLWIMSTGGGSLLCSKDLKEWQIMHLGVRSPDVRIAPPHLFGHMLSNEINGMVVAAMGNFVMIIDSKDIGISSVGVVQHYAFYSRLKGLGYTAKRRILSICDSASARIKERE